MGLLCMCADLNEKEEEVVLHGQRQSREKFSACPFAMLDLVKATVFNKE